ncbi:NADH-quinone oxidoreductase subunit N [Criblamydia sequanensis]|uniref:NADH-quinone oxidoreductase subunit N n=1 Tax=Candidatus Criblamydia sequanensis CRIB-18 TaxID=1437425 RepID=A0A090D0Q6_9BACT|nr:NADH-quinone oxidoreductase subunit N [Criblamydia sequanensis]CDR33445.1 NADH-quinone oxidoreductase subunit N [Criblamydia sequanensis CRIB-18]
MITKNDILALSPLLILLGFGLLLLLLECFYSKETKKYGFLVASLAFILALFFSMTPEKPLGEFLSPWIKSDRLGHLFTLLFLSIGFFVTLISASFFSENETDCDVTQGEYYFLLLSAIAGLILISISADFLTLFLGFETFSLALYVLTAYIKKWKVSHEASFKYFIMGAFASGILLYGIAFVYGGIGNTAFDGMEKALDTITVASNKTLFLTGLIFITVGLCFKAAIVPFHAWAPDVYEGASIPVTAFMAVGAKAGAFAAFARIFLSSLPNLDERFNQMLVYLAIATLIYASFVMLRQFQFRRFFAYSGISHAAFLLIPIAASDSDSLLTLLFYLVVYSLATIGVFGVAAMIQKKGEGFNLNNLKGLFHRSPFLASLLAICLLTLAGIPPTAGFFAKFFVFKEAFQKGYYIFVTVGLLTSILSAYYYLKIMSTLFTRSFEEGTSLKVSLPSTLASLLSFVLIVIISLFPITLISLVR